MSRKIHLFIFALMAVPSTMASAGDEDSSIESSEMTGLISKPLLQFTSKIFKPFSGQENVVLSPISIHKGLSMVLLGADESTQTKDELLETLGLKGLKEDEINKCLSEYAALIAKFKKVTEESQKLYQEREKHPQNERDFGRKPPILDIFNTVITKHLGDTLPAYEEKVKKYFDSSLVKVDDKKPETKTKVLDKLNGWAKEAGFSQPIVKQEDLDDDFSAFLLSAIRVQAFWFGEFNEYEDKQSPIFFNHGKKDNPVKGYVLAKSHPNGAKYLELTSEDKTKYKFLHEKISKSNSAKLFEELSPLNIQVAEVALQGNLSFAIFEPLNESDAGGDLDKLVDQLMQTNKSSNSSKFEQVFSLLDSDLGANHISHIAFPKFGFENDINLKGHLQSMGLNRAFNRMTAQISGMTTNKLFIEKISHQAMIEVNKFGIKAAGVTKITMKLLSAMFTQNPINVQIKNPFLFTIRYGRLPLFIGRLDTLPKA